MPFQFRRAQLLAVRLLSGLQATTDYACQIWAKSTSIVGAGAESKPHAVQVPLNIDGTIIKPGDLVFSDAINGVVIIPQDQVSEVVSLLPYLVEADDRVKGDVSNGMTVHEAFKKHRGQ